VYDLEYHLVAVTKYRHPVLTEELTKRLVEISHSLLEGNWPCKIIGINTSVDHVHILFEAPPQVQLSKLINNYKTITSRLLRKEFAEFLSQYYWKPYFWSSSYFVATVSDRTRDAVAAYIREQERGNKVTPNPS
jgi:putative transposase